MSGWIDPFRKLWGWLSSSPQAPIGPAAIVLDKIQFQSIVQSNLSFTSKVINNENFVRRY